MGYCSKHRLGFREPADEQGDHGCPSCHQMARDVGDGRWVDRVEELEAEVARLKSMLQDARKKRQPCKTCKGTRMAQIAGEVPQPCRDCIMDPDG